MSKDDNKNEGKNLGIGSEIAREGYEASVVHRMTGRAGASTIKGAPGNALEIMANDKRNMKNLLKPDTVTKLTKSSTATQVDAVTTKSGKVIERIQYFRSSKNCKSGKIRKISASTTLGNKRSSKTI